ncbi:MAG: TrkA family potassium uptake protein [Eubacteriales bacterium]|nr:TrkA family potassium uptake protein [Eubacteriales bacterium]
MKILIMGGGKLAQFLSDILIKKEHEIAIIERDRSVCKQLVLHFGDALEVYHGDGSNIHLLRRAHCEKFDCYIAVSGQDENNLIACQIAKQHFKVALTIARINNPLNEEVFKRLGVDRTYSSIGIIADMIEQNIDYNNMRVMYEIEDTSKRIIELLLSPQSKIAGVPLMKAKLPDQVKVVLIHRGKDIYIPDGNTVLQGGDLVLFLCDEADYETLYREFVHEN